MIGVWPQVFVWPQVLRMSMAEAVQMLGGAIQMLVQMLGEAMSAAAAGLES